MKTTTLSTPVHRKLIDIPEDTFRSLSVKAALAGISLKKLIENLLDREAEETDDVETYRMMIKNRPEGKVLLSDKEQEAFEQKFRLGQYR
ncbi:MAG: hypothetical protein J1E99_05190 [Muribaculaceae bacterium]|nr:hypothetical protein [Muribaculaceae bacterium]